MLVGLFDCLSKEKSEVAFFNIGSRSGSCRRGVTVYSERKNKLTSIAIQSGNCNVTAHMQYLITSVILRRYLNSVRNFVKLAALSECRRKFLFKIITHFKEFSLETDLMKPKSDRQIIRVSNSRTVSGSFSIIQIRHQSMVRPSKYTIY